MQILLVRKENAATFVDRTAAVKRGTQTKKITQVAKW